MGVGNIFSGINFPGAIKRKNKKSLSLSGFTFIELLVVMAMLSVLLTMLAVIINPVKQLQKARDAQRVQDIKQIANALDTYYNDKNSYPAPASLSFGGNWLPYMRKIPQDPNCASGGSCYTYITDPVNLQWNVLFAKAENKTNSSTACSLEQLSSCVPTNYVIGGYYCVLSGKVDCSVLRITTLP